MRVETTTGNWQVHRRWTPRRLRPDSVWQRLKNRSRKGRRALDYADAASPPGGCGIDLLEGIVVVIFLLLALVFIFMVGIPLLIAIGELVILLLLVIIGLISKVLFRRPWTIDATSPENEITEWHVIGWRKSVMARDYVADRIRIGAPLPSQSELDAAILSE